eukprot:9465705-Ditylum_brightwellii.AAC.1
MREYRTHAKTFPNSDAPAGPRKCSQIPSPKNSSAQPTSSKPKSSKTETAIADMEMELQVPQYSDDNTREDKDNLPSQTEDTQHSLQQDNCSDSEEDNEDNDDISYSNDFFNAHDQGDLLQLVQAYPEQNQNIRKFYAVGYNSKRIKDFLTMTAEVAPRKH